MIKIGPIVLAATLMATMPALAKTPPHLKVTMEQARATALQKVPGKIVHEELEHEKGRWIYSIEVRPAGETGKHIKEVNLDANSGDVVEIGDENE
jgi:uncharacterized membrane protein YkoI